MCLRPHDWKVVELDWEGSPLAPGTQTAVWCAVQTGSGFPRAESSDPGKGAQESKAGPG